MSAGVMVALALLCFVAAAACLCVAIRDLEFLNVIDETYAPIDPPHIGWFAAAVVLLIAFVMLGVGALVKAT